jgi:hypothetical protein
VIADQDSMNSNTVQVYMGTSELLQNKVIASILDTPNGLIAKAVTAVILNQIKAALGNTSINISSTNTWEQQ